MPLLVSFPRPRLFTAALTCGFTLALAPALPLAQAADEKVEFPAASPHAVLRQRVGVTDVEADYSRPSKNGREIFGALVPFGAVWRTGANASTKISFSDPVRVEGKEIPAGKYALYTIPTKDEWTVILYKDLSLWGSNKYKPSDDVARFTVKPETLSAPVETFTIDFDNLKEDSATMVLAWDRTRVPVKLTVDTLGKVNAGISKATASADGANPELLAQAAGFYLSHNLDLNKALGWINQAAEKNPKAYNLFARKAQIQAKLGDKAGAGASVDKSIELAKASPDDADADTMASLEKFRASLR